MDGLRSPLQQQDTAAAAAAGSDIRVAWQAVVVAPSTGTLQTKGLGCSPSPKGSAAGQGSEEGVGLVQLFAVAGELAPDVAALLPDVLVVTAKQLRSEIMVDVAQVRIACYVCWLLLSDMLLFSGSKGGCAAT
jgi:hypothetical protein